MVKAACHAVHHALVQQLCIICSGVFSLQSLPTPGSCPFPHSRPCNPLGHASPRPHLTPHN